MITAPNSVTAEKHFFWRWVYRLLCISVMNYAIELEKLLRLLKILLKICREKCVFVTSVLQVLRKKILKKGRKTTFTRDDPLKVRNVATIEDLFHLKVSRIKVSSKVHKCLSIHFVFWSIVHKYLTQSLSKLIKRSLCPFRKNWVAVIYHY